ncbi:MAG: ammonium transporter [Pseudomonadota bacterium]|nr:ammonium transporter [Pseudomonadota bacterium]
MDFFEVQFALDTFYAVMAGALVMWMAAGFTMLEAGMVRAKNASEIVTKNLGLYSIACIMYLTCGFYLMYSSGDYLGGLLPQIGSHWSLAVPEDTVAAMQYGADGDVGYYAEQADFFFQVVFVATAMSIVSGAVAGRMKMLPFFLFAVVLTGFIYPIQGYWNWGEGFLNQNGYSDYAGSGTVHLCGAAAALAVVTVLGARNGKYNSDGSANLIPGSNIPMAALGVWILWLGWFGFNGGSELKVSTGGSAIAVAQVFMNTNLAATGGVVATLLTSLIKTGKMDITMAMNGAIAGLVAITAGPSAPSGGEAVIIGAVGGVIVYFSILFFERTLKVDDPVGAISAHGTVGIYGVMVVPLTSDATFGAQLLGVVLIAGFTYVMSLLTIYVINLFMPIRASDTEQEVGLDLTETGVEAYPDF